MLFLLVLHLQRGSVRGNSYQSAWPNEVFRETGHLIRFGGQLSLVFGRLSIHLICSHPPQLFQVSDVHINVLMCMFKVRIVARLQHKTGINNATAIVVSKQS